MTLQHWSFPLPLHRRAHAKNKLPKNLSTKGMTRFQLGVETKNMSELRSIARLGIFEQKWAPNIFMASQFVLNLNSGTPPPLRPAKDIAKQKSKEGDQPDSVQSPSQTNPKPQISNPTSGSEPGPPNSPPSRLEVGLLAATRAHQQQLTHEAVRQLRTTPLQGCRFRRGKG